MDFDKYLKSLEEQAKKNDIGKIIASGIGVSLDETSYKAITAVENVYVELETLTKNAAKNAENLDKKRKKRALANLKNALELGLLTEQEYYEKLKKYRDENLRVGTDAWFSATEEIASYNRKLTEETEKQQLALLEQMSAARQEVMEKEAKRQIELLSKVLAMEKKLGEKLGKQDGEWFSSQKIIIRGQKIGGGDIVYQKKTLEDFKKETLLLEKYGESVHKLEELGNIPDRVFSDIAAMDIEDALTAMDVILSADEATRKKFTEGYGAHISLVDSMASELNPILNKEALKELGIESADSFNKGFFDLDTSEKGRFIKMLEESFESVPESYYKLGVEAGTFFGNGFEQELDAILENARNQTIDAVKDAASEYISMLQSTDGKVGQEPSKVYNTAFNFSSVKETIREQLLTAKNEALLAKLRGDL
ncbi:MAG: hypothetical protein IJ285_06290 [Clostridia bacterium]|nr:hypothetical protein [Clostridia bacterium]